MDEIGYWEAIQQLRQLNDRLTAVKRSGKATPEQLRALVQLHHLMAVLATGLRREHQVLLPGEEPREGYEAYADWYQRVASVANAREYSWTICSGCVFSKGLEEYSWGSRRAPCRQFAGQLPFGDELGVCPRLNVSTLTPFQLLVELFNISDAAVDKFRSKEEEVGTPTEYRLPNIPR